LVIAVERGRKPAHGRGGDAVVQGLGSALPGLELRQQLRVDAALTVRHVRLPFFKVRAPNA